ncbi:uncharacterized protein LOC110087787 [Pogona vitticeps]
MHYVTVVWPGIPEETPHPACALWWIMAASEGALHQVSTFCDVRCIGMRGPPFGSQTTLSSRRIRGVLHRRSLPSCVHSQRPQRRSPYLEKYARQTMRTLRVHCINFCSKNALGLIFRGCFIFFTYNNLQLFKCNHVIFFWLLHNGGGRAFT